MLSACPTRRARTRACRRCQTPSTRHESHVSNDPSWSSTTAARSMRGGAKTRPNFRVEPHSRAGAAQTSISAARSPRRDATPRRHQRGAAIQVPTLATQRRTTIKNAARKHPNTKAPCCTATPPGSSPNPQSSPTSTTSSSSCRRLMVRSPLVYWCSAACRSPEPGGQLPAGPRRRLAAALDEGVLGEYL